MGWVDRVAEPGRTFWPAFDDEERETVVAHCRASDYPETAAWWLSLGEAGGFASARDLLEAPPGLGAGLWVCRLNVRARCTTA